MAGVLDSISKVCVVAALADTEQGGTCVSWETPGLLLQAFKKPDPKELVRKWQADLRAEQRKIDRQIRGEKGRLALPASPSQPHSPRPGRCFTNCMFEASSSRANKTCGAVLCLLSYCCRHPV